MNKFVYRALCRNYEQSAKAMLHELKRHKIYNSLLKSPALLAYQENLKLLRMFLDNEGIVMPQPKWHYDDKDQSTWLFTPQQSLNKTFLMLQARRR